MEGVAVPKTGLKNALLRDNLYMMGAACFPCAREQTPVDALYLGVLASRINCALAITSL